ncbi:MAG: hypothetical protein EXX96DRAFT_95664 [Benjaminiella poitrasii]|nr:MAG: hypothetical protein EXX96DRAFT_95664 [Benjaminiella poitrasii]
MVIKVQKLSHKDNREVAPFVYKPDAGMNLPSIPTDVSVFDMLFIKNKHKIESSRAIYIDAETEEVMTYGQLKHDILSIATGLRKQLGLQFGDVVAICCPNHIQFPSLFHGVVCAGLQIKKKKNITCL